MRIRILSPRYGSIFQRDNMDMANIPVKVKCSSRQNIEIHAFLVPEERTAASAVPEGIKSVKLKKRSGCIYKGTISAKKGPWYTLVVEEHRGNKNVAQKRIKHIGVGDIFLLAGQSNSANSGGEKMKSQTGMVMALGKKKWHIAHDPQPLATGKGGSPWAPMGDQLVKIWHHPIGLVSVGVGGSAVGEWDPESGQYYPRMQEALNRLKPHGLRAVLWHQGESDAVAGTSVDVYKRTLLKVITQSRADWGEMLSWIVARASFVPDETVPKVNFQQVRTAQTEVCAEEKVYPGPDTDDLLGNRWRHDLLHFGREGLPEHGRRWAQVILDLYP
jgi:hypothetical protein